MSENSWIGRHWLNGKVVRVAALDGKIAKLEEVEDGAGDTGLYADRWIAPGLIDVQVNGIHGIDFNDPALTPEQFREAVRYLHTRGVTRFCPTVVTAERGRMLACVGTVADACERWPEVEEAVLGIHVEGPFISEEDGPRGAHSRDCTRDPDWAEYEGWQARAGGRVRMVTLDPARRGAAAFIRRLAGEGVIAAIGHTAASGEDIAAAVEAGATMSTHLGNGAHPVLRRHPNYIWEQLARDELWAGLIGDGHHLPPATLKSMIRAKGSKAILVSDANHFEGMPPGRYMKRNRHEVILHENGRLVMADNPDIFSGAATPLNRCVANVARFGICPLSDAIRMASLHPAELFGRDREGLGSLREGGPADLIVYDSSGPLQFEIVQTVAGGRTVFG